MQTLELNLASRPFRNNTLYWLGYGLGAVLILVTTFWNASAYVDYSQRLENLAEIEGTIEKKTAELQRRDNAAQRAIGTYNLADLATQALKANDVIDAKAFSWTRLFNQLENVLPYPVRMVSVRPQFRFGQQGRRQAENVPEGAVPVGVEGIAKELRGMLEFQRTLIEDVHFSRVEPDRWSRVPGGQEVLFTLRFLYFPDGDPVELAARAEAEAAAAAEAEAVAAAEAEAEADAEAGPEQDASGEGDGTDQPAGEGEPAVEPGPEGNRDAGTPQANIVESAPPEPESADAAVTAEPWAGDAGDEEPVERVDDEGDDDEREDR